MSNRKKSEHSTAHLEVSNEQENADNSPGQQNAHVNFAFQSWPDDQEQTELEPGKNDQFNLTKIVRRSSLEAQTEEDFISVQSSLATSELQTVVRWENLEVEVTAQGETKRILDKISGQTTNLEILAILGKPDSSSRFLLNVCKNVWVWIKNKIEIPGPSGAGKTTLLNILAGRIRNYNGTAKFYSNEQKIGFAYVPQVDQLAPYLTVKESLLFASKFKNPANADHQKEVNYVIDAFNLNTTRSHYSSKCSGGERKRLSIALEMISKPKILLLDEPTTGRWPLFWPKEIDYAIKTWIFFPGLDSTTAYQVIEVLKVSL